MQLVASVWQDLRYAVRTMRRSPGFTAVAIVSMALGIGANTAIFSLIDSVMLRMLPVERPEELVELLHTFPGDPRLGGVDMETYANIRANNRTLAGVIGSAPTECDGGEAGRLRCEYVNGEYFGVLGLRPAIGRLLSPADDPAGGGVAPVAVVSWSYWRSRLNQDPAALGRQLTIGKTPVTVVGVAPRGFFGLTVGVDSQVWLPLGLRQGGRGVALLGRLKPGVSMGQAQDELARMYFQGIDPAKRASDYYLSRLKVEVAAAGTGMRRAEDQFGKPLLLVMALVGLVLLLACTNLASMLLARGAAREREMAVRVSLGAGRMRLARQTLTESVLLSGAGAALGTLVAYAGAGALVRVLMGGRALERVEIPLHADWRVLVFTAAAALLTGVLFGLVPALRAMAASPASCLRAAGRASETRFGRLFGRGLVSGQIALSVVLLSAASLFTGHLTSLRRSVGFERDRLLVLSLDPSGSGYNNERLSSGYRDVLARLEAIAGVRSATLSGMTPLSGAGASRYVTVEGFAHNPAAERRLLLNWVAPKYFATLGTPVLAGREFTFQDRGARLAVVNQAMARFYFGETNPIGRRFTLERETQPYEIVGVAADAKYTDAREAAPRTAYLFALPEGRVFGHQFVLRTAGPPYTIERAARRAVAEALPGIAVRKATTMAEQVDATIIPERLVAMLSSAFGGLGALLAATGLYGLLAYTVARRSGEIAIRMALGATQPDVRRMVLGEALAMAAVGLAVGVPVALSSRGLAGRVLEGLPGDSWVAVAWGAAGIVTVALLGAYFPARRAARVDPVESLRQE